MVEFYPNEDGIESLMLVLDFSVEKVFFVQSQMARAMFHRIRKAWKNQATRVAARWHSWNGSSFSEDDIPF